MTRWCWGVALGAVLSIFAVSPALAQQFEEGDPHAYGNGTLRLGGFFVTQFNTNVIVRSPDVPFGLVIDFDRDLGLTDSLLVPRLFFNWRFSKRHRMGFDVFNTRRDTTLILEEELELGDTLIPVGASFSALTDVTVYKAVYSYLFHDSEKVVLGASVGLNWIDSFFAFEAEYDVGGSDPDIGRREEFKDSTGLAAPLPVIGFRLAYRPTPRLSVIAASNVLWVEIGGYGGTYLDTYGMVDYRLTKLFSVIGGINLLNLDVNVDDDDLVAQLSHNYRGLMLMIGFHF